MSTPLNTPVLFCIYNRPQLTAQVFEAIRKRQPRRLFISSDGPRNLIEGDNEKVARAREIVSQVDWECEVETRMLPDNLGCKHAMSSAISWAFEKAEELIILEDDCLPGPSFFGYCEALLNRYRERQEVMMISGNNFQPRPRSDASYYFSRWTHIWGWATWKRAWQQFDLEVSSWPRLKREKQLRNIFRDPAEYAHWARTLDSQYAGNIDTWDFPWAYAVWANNGLSILPEKNLVTNIGFGDDATHTKDAASKLAKIPACDLGQLLHPINISINDLADRYTWKSVFEPLVAAKKQSRPYFSRLGLLKSWLTNQSDVTQ